MWFFLIPGRNDREDRLRGILELTSQVDRSILRITEYA